MAKGVTIDLIVDPKKAIQGISDVESKASGASDALGKLGQVAGAALVGLAAAAAAGAVALGGAVVSAYADYEQLAGGVTKLFGEADAAVMQYAANAAQTAGLSTNAYLDTVTSFSASLIAGLGGDQAKAAQIADMAISDMADNANTFGTSMESLQTTYNGFAKGSFAMLDNLKLGYGGTAGEMARLINESGVLNGAFEATAQNVKDIPFSTMIEAIHAVQERMNIAGTTAREASSTITGSFVATKASLSNLVLGMGQADADLEGLVGGVLENASNLLNNVGSVLERLAESVPKIVPVLVAALDKVLPALLPMASNLITAVLRAIVTAAPRLVQGAVPIITNFATGLLAMLPAILDAGLKIVISLIQGIAAALPELIPAAVQAVLGLVGALIANLPMLIIAGIDLLLGLAEGLIDAIPQLLEALPLIISSLITGLLQALPRIMTAGVQLLIALVKNLPAIIYGIVSAVPEIIKALYETFTDPKFWKQMGDAGLQLIRGLWEGIKNAGDWLWRQIQGFFGGVIRNIKALFGIRSPSTVFAEFGDFMIQGLEEGLTGPNHIDGIMSDLSKQVTGGFKGSLQAEATATLASSGGVGMGSSGNVTIEVNLHGVVGGPEAGRAVVAALQEYVRNGGRGLSAVMS